MKNGIFPYNTTRYARVYFPLLLCVLHFFTLNLTWLLQKDVSFSESYTVFHGKSILEEKWICFLLAFTFFKVRFLENLLNHVIYLFPLMNYNLVPPLEKKFS